jgi:hypothetical protein
VHTSHRCQDFWVASSDCEHQALESGVGTRTIAAGRVNAPRALAHTQNELTPPGSDTPLLLARHSEVLIRQTSAVTNVHGEETNAHAIAKKRTDAKHLFERRAPTSGRAHQRAGGRTNERGAADRWGVA